MRNYGCYAVSSTGDTGPTRKRRRFRRRLRQIKCRTPCRQRPSGISLATKGTRRGRPPARGVCVLAFPWLTALKIIPWGDVIEHAPKVLSAARQLVDRQRSRPTETPPPTPPLPTDTPPDAMALARELAALRGAQQRAQQTQAQLAQTVADLAEQNTRLVEAVDLLRRRTRLLLVVAALLALALAWLAA